VRDSSGYPAAHEKIIFRNKELRGVKADSPTLTQEGTRPWKKKVVSRQLSVSSCQSSVVSQQLSVVGCQSAVGCEKMNNKQGRISNFKFSNYFQSLQ
jgi:hypothetical protein